jgi:aspartyl-tRNA(Asn)/glutamyl-tRNA(Gln) amidotransferase subunit C
MANLSKEEILHIAKLSRLELTDEEVSLYGDQLSSVLDYFDQLKEVDTAGTEDCNNVTGLENITQEDEISPSGITHEDIQKNAPKFEDSAFVVPAVFE